MIMAAEYTKEDCIKDTMEHIELVNSFLLIISRKMMEDGWSHDRSKLIEPELSGFTEASPLLSKDQYGSKAYKKGLEILNESGALQHHYVFNKHHPESHKFGVSGMSLVDVVVMFCDWLASIKRNPGGNMAKSIKFKNKNGTIDDQLATIFLNTYRQLFAGK